MKTPWAIGWVAGAGLTLLGVWPYQAYGSDERPRGSSALPDLIREALARNPEILAARQQWQASRSRIRQAGSLDDPSFQVQLWNFPQSFDVTQTRNTILTLSQKYPFPGKLALRAGVASATADMNEQVLRAKQRDLIARVKKAFYDLVLAHEAIRIHHEQLALLREFFEIANARFRAGKGRQVDVLKAQVELSREHQQLPVLEQSRDTAQAGVNTLLDRDPRFPVIPSGGPRDTRVDMDLEELMQRAMKARPELKAAGLAVQRNQQAQALARRNYYPDFNVAFQRFQNFQANDGFGAIVSMNVPLAFWTKPKYDAAVQEAVAAVGAAQADLRTLANLTRFQIRDLLAKVRASWEVAVLYKTTVVPQAEQTLESARTGYRTGRTTFLDLIDAERALREFELAYYRALVERESRLADLEQVVGTEF